MRIGRNRWRGIVLLAGVALLAADGWSAAVGGGRFGDADGWSRWLDSPIRDAWQKPDEVIAALGLARNAVVAEIGSGTGYFAVRLARAVPDGRVYGADIEPGMVEHLAGRAAAEKIPNLIALQATREGPGLPEPVDLVLLVNVQGLTVNPGNYFQRLRASLRPGARVAVIAYRPDSPGGALPAMRAPAEQVVRDMTRQGYTLVAAHDFLPHQHFLVFRP
jgi:SAM-dependent methyltransferase